MAVWPCASWRRSARSRPARRSSSTTATWCWPAARSLAASTPSGRPPSAPRCWPPPEPERGGVMLLAVDVGNTNIVPGVFAPDGRLAADWRWETDNARMADEYAALLGWALADVGIARGAITGMVLSSVVPPLTTTFCELARRYLGVVPLVVSAGVRTDVPL